MRVRRTYGPYPTPPQTFFPPAHARPNPQTAARTLTAAVRIAAAGDRCRAAGRQPRFRHSDHALAALALSDHRLRRVRPGAAEPPPGSPRWHVAAGGRSVRSDRHVRLVRPGLERLAAVPDRRRAQHHFLRTPGVPPGSGSAAGDA